jgi:hypothetical protein
VPGTKPRKCDQRRYGKEITAPNYHTVLIGGLMSFSMPFLPEEPWKKAPDYGTDTP